MPASSVKKEKQGAGMVDGECTASQSRQEVLKKAPKKLAVSKDESEPKKKAKVKKEGDREVKQPAYKCKKNDGRGWQCRRPVRRPNSLCDYHFYQKRAYLNPEFAALVAAETEPEAEMEVPQPAPASKAATSSKSSRKKKSGNDSGVTEGFYYYAGFGPCRSKRLCRSSSMNEFVPPKKEEEEEPAEDGSPTNELAQAAADDTNQLTAGGDGESSCDDVARIAGVDEGSSDDNHGPVSSGRHRVGNSDGKRKNGCKRWRKPVKARSLKSLMQASIEASVRAAHVRA